MIMMTIMIMATLIMMRGLLGHWVVSIQLAGLDDDNGIDI